MVEQSEAAGARDKHVYEPAGVADALRRGPRYVEQDICAVLAVHLPNPLG